MPRITDRLGLTIINGLSVTARGRAQSFEYGDEDRQRLDWYQPPSSCSKTCVLFFYGGNWRSGDRADYRFVADQLLSWGFQVMIPDYRLYPRVRFDAILSDAVQATNRCLELLDRDTTLIIMGHSAGAQLGALLTLNTSLAVSERVSGFVGLAGPYDFYPFSEDDHWDLFGPEDLYAESQAVNFVQPQAAPLYLLHGREDRRVRRGHSKSLMEKQREAGGVANRAVYDGVGHVGLVLTFAPWLRQLPRNRRVLSDVRRFLQSPLHDQA